MQSAAPDVSAYLREVPADRQACLAALRGLCKEILVGYEESMEYGMPCYKKHGVMRVAFASQRNYISLYVPDDPAVAIHRDALSGVSQGKSCVRFGKPDTIDFSVVRKILEATAAHTP